MRVLLFNSLAPSSEMPRVVGIWRQNLRKVSERASQSLADPEEYPDLFPDLEHALAVEQWLKQNDRMIPAFGYADVKGNIFRNLIEGATTVYSLFLFFSALCCVRSLSCPRDDVHNPDVVASTVLSCISLLQKPKTDRCLPSKKKSSLARSPRLLKQHRSKSTSPRSRVHCRANPLQRMNQQWPSRAQHLFQRVFPPLSLFLPLKQRLLPLPMKILTLMPRSTASLPARTLKDRLLKVRCRHGYFNC